MRDEVESLAMIVIVLVFFQFFNVLRSESEESDFATRHECRHTKAEQSYAYDKSPTQP